MSTLGARIVPGDPDPKGYRRLHRAAGEALLERRDLGGRADPHHRELRSLLCFVQLSDLHVTDAQSPARAEFLDRFGDADAPEAAVLGRIGTYRAQEALTYQVVEAMAQAVRAALEEGGPATGAPFAFAIATGDNTDNCQRNELEDYLSLLDGRGEVRPDSGDFTRYEGVGSPQAYDERYWHPDGTPAGTQDDLPRAQRGFPTVPGLLDACRRPFRPSGLGLPWYAVYGNHDALLVGTQPPDAALSALATGDQKPSRLPEGVDVRALLAGTQTGPSPAGWGMIACPMRAVTADLSRRFVDAREWITAHLEAPGAPAGHGFDPTARDQARAYYACDAGAIRLIVLDTVNHDGGWQGCIGADQFAWLEDELVAGHSRYRDADGALVSTGHEDRLFILFAHHSVETLINPWSPDGTRRHLGEDLLAMLARFANVVLFVNGHTHEHAVRAFPAPRPDGSPGGFWQVTTGSHIDWPQQSRLIEIAVDEVDGDLVIATAMLDHAGPVDPRAGDLEDPLTLAGWSRELAVNAWQGRSKPDEPWGRGEAGDRNVVLVVPAPFALHSPAARAGLDAPVAR